MKLVLKNTLGESVSLQIRPEDTFIDLKERVEDEAGISLAISNIAQNGKFQETQRVFEYFVSQSTEYDEDAVLEGPISDGDQDVECAVPGCTNTKQSRPDKVFFDFPQLPQDEVRCHQWVLYCQRLSMASGKHRLNLSQESSICSDHFKPDQFVKNTTTLLKRTAVPCINPELPSVGSIKNFGPRPRSPVDTQDDALTTMGGERVFICRLCATLCTDVIFIYGGEGRRLLLPEKINACLPIKVKMTDNLPKQVCRECVEELDSLKDFAQLCLDSNLSLTRSHFESRDICGSCPLCAEGNINKCEEVPTEEEDDLVCQLCNEVFEDTEEFSKHSHDDVFFHCNECENYYNTFEDLDEHVMTSHRKEDEEVTCGRCAMSFESQAVLDDHNCDNHSSISNKCHLCHKVFRSNYRLEFHLKFHYGAKVGYCELCRKNFNDEVKLYKHTVYRHSVDKTFQCDECDKVFRSTSSLKYHQRNHSDHDLRPFTCEWCGKCFIRKTMLTNHITSTHKNTAQVSTCFSCKVCSEAFPSTNVAVVHMDSKHKEDCIDASTYSFEMHTVNKVYVCEYCDRCFVEAQTLNKHREAHVSEIPYECKYCMLSFSSGGELNEHKMAHPDEELPLEYTTNFQVPLTYLCEYCDRCFVNYVKFTEHLTIHFRPEPYQCRTCNAYFKTLEEVTEHKLNHPLEEPSFDLNNYRPYECHYCTKAFAIEDALVKHIRMHTGEKPFICVQCGKGFSQSSGLYTHMKVHSSIRPYSCSLCPRTFKIKGDRDVHVRKHSGDRPYKCEYCQKAFMTQHVYSQHRKIHTGERPYKCDVCGIAFRRSHVLTVHKRIHTGEKPNICDICGKRYRQKGDMLKHRRTQHGLNKQNPPEELREIFN